METQTLIAVALILIAIVGVIAVLINGVRAQRVIAAESGEEDLDKLAEMIEAPEPAPTLKERLSEAKKESSSAVWQESVAADPTEEEEPKSVIMRALKKRKKKDENVAVVQAVITADDPTNTPPAPSTDPSTMDFGFESPEPFTPPPLPSMAFEEPTMPSLEVPDLGTPDFEADPTVVPDLAPLPEPVADMSPPVDFEVPDLGTPDFEADPTVVPNLAPLPDAADFGFADTAVEQVALTEDETAPQLPADLGWEDDFGPSPEVAAEEPTETLITDAPAPVESTKDAPFAVPEVVPVPQAAAHTEPVPVPVAAQAPVAASPQVEAVETASVVAAEQIHTEPVPVPVADSGSPAPLDLDFDPPSDSLPSADQSFGWADGVDESWTDESGFFDPSGEPDDAGASDFIAEDVQIDEAVEPVMGEADHVPAGIGSDPQPEVPQPTLVQPVMMVPVDALPAEAQHDPEAGSVLPVAMVAPAGLNGSAAGSSLLGDDAGPVMRPEPSFGEHSESVEYPFEAEVDVPESVSDDETVSGLVEADPVHEPAHAAHSGSLPLDAVSPETGWVPIEKSNGAAAERRGGVVTLSNRGMSVEEAVVTALLEDPEFGSLWLPPKA